MNSPFLRTLFDIDNIPADAGNINLVWERPFGPWLWFLFILIAVTLAFWSYSRLHGNSVGRMILAGVRTIAIVLALIVLSGPMLELPREVIEPDWVLMLVDRSESMTIEDAPGSDGETTAAARRSRDQQLRTLLEDNRATWGELADERRVLWLGFNSGAFNLGGDRGVDAGGNRASNDSNGAEVVNIDPGAADGSRTRLSHAIDQALQRAAARPISGVVVFSDGRTEDPPDRALLRRLQSDHVRVYTVPLGSEHPLGDIAVRRVEAPQRAFTRDKVPVVVHIDRLGAAGSGIGATVRLVDEVTGEQLDEQTLEAGAESDQITLTASPSLSGEATWKVVLDTAEPDLIPDNNTKNFMIDLVDRPLKVLFVEGYPRWEYRYLKNLLVREESIESSVMLISADRDFAQEGNQPITRLPRSPEEFADYDVLIIGDVPGSFFSPDQLDMMRAHVSERGAGLLWIAGERKIPETYAGTALADLIPLRGSLKLASIGQPILMQPTELADRLGVLQLVTSGQVGWPRELIDANYGWSQLYWAQHIEPGRLKPAAVALAETVQEFGGEHLPLVIQMRYGAGQSVYVATDEIWRWRYGRGEDLTEQFWVQLIRMLGRESLSSAGQRLVLSASPRRAEAGQPVRIDVQLLDAQLIDTFGGHIVASIETEQGEKIAELTLAPVEGTEDRFAATYLLDRAGTYRVRLPYSGAMGITTEVPLDVYSPDDEMRRPETDHDLLIELSAATGGQVLDRETISSLPEILPNRSIKTLNPLTERIWDTPAIFILALLLLTLEWVGRKIVRLA